MHIKELAEEGMLSENDASICETLTGLYLENRRSFEALRSRFLNQMTDLARQGQTNLDRLIHDETNETITLFNVLGLYNGQVRDLQHNFINYLETFFKIKYDLCFTSLLETATTESLVNLKSYEPIINNMVRQLGPDFKKSGIGLQMRKICDMAAFDSKPQLYHRWISFENIVSYQIAECELPRLTRAIKIKLILSALSLYLSGQEEPTNGMKQLLIRLQDHFHLKEHT